MKIENLKLDYAQIGGVRLHYATAGTGEKLVILLHGFPEFWYSWRHQIEFLSADFTVVAPDLRGYNLSDKPQAVGEYKTDKLVDDVTGLIRHFGRDKAFIVGHDWGAGVAWQVALRQPAYVEKIACLQVPPPAAWRKNAGFAQLLTSWYMFVFQLPRFPEWLLSRDDFAGLTRVLRGLTTKPIFDSAAVAEYKKAWSEDGALTGMVNYYRANLAKFYSFDSKTKNEPQKITAPTLFIYGEKDKAVLPSTTRNIERFIDAPYSELRIADAGHWIHQECPNDVNEVLLDFLKD